MNTIRFLSMLGIAALAGCASTRNDIGSTQETSKSKTTAHAGDAAQMQLPPGVSAEDMQACAIAGTPGSQHQQLARGAGHWSGTQTIWMSAEAPPATNPVTANVTNLMDRYMKTEVNGDMPGMGPFTGLGFTGFDNVTQKYVATWMDNCMTGIMTGDGSMSSDGKTLTLNYHYTCPITKKPTTMREVQHHTSDNAMTLDMYGPDPHSGKEFHMVHLEMTRAAP